MWSFGSRWQRVDAELALSVMRFIAAADSHHRAGGFVSVHRGSIAASSSIVELMPLPYPAILATQSKRDVNRSKSGMHGRVVSQRPMCRPALEYDVAMAVCLDMKFGGSEVRQEVHL